MTAPFVPGCFPEMPAETYFEIEALSNSGAGKLLQSPMHYKLDRETKNEPSKAMIFGSAVHMGVLEPARFITGVAAVPELNLRTKEGKAQWENFASENVGKLLLPQDDHQRAAACISAVLGHKGARYLLEGAQTEVSLFWEDGQYKVPCKARFDAANRGVMIDVKTTRDASPEEFAKSIASFGYHRQGAHYLSGAEHVLNETPRAFVFIAVESEPPHAVACYALDGASIRAGQHQMAIALERYAECLKNGMWPGYAETIESITIPRWALRFDG